MPRYFFHTEDGSCFPDDHGVELPDLVAARITALRVLVEMVPTMAHDLWQDGSFRVIAADDKGLHLFSIELSAHDAPAVSPPKAAALGTGSVRGSQRSGD